MIYRYEDPVADWDAFCADHEERLDYEMYTRSQTDKIKEYLMEHKEGITPMDALNLFGCFRLSARISDLKRFGYNIVSERETRGGKTYCRYRMEE